MQDLITMPEEITEYNDFHEGIEEALAMCGNPRHRTFALAIASGTKSNHQCAELAQMHYVTAKKILFGDEERFSGVRRAIKSLRRIFQAKFGAKAEWKRAQLISIVETCNDSSSPHYQPGSVIKAVEQLNRMDGDLAATKVEHTGEIIMNVEYDIVMPQRESMREIGATVISEQGAALSHGEPTTAHDFIQASEEFALA